MATSSDILEIAMREYLTRMPAPPIKFAFSVGDEVRVVAAKHSSHHKIGTVLEQRSFDMRFEPYYLVGFRKPDGTHQLSNYLESSLELCNARILNDA